MIQYTDNKKYAYFDGLKYTRDDRTGYYLNSTHRQRLHRAVWEKNKGEIPTDYHIHHIDGDNSNNNIDNLECIPYDIHLQHHGQQRVMNNREWFQTFNRKGREAAKEWHASDEGRQWHKEHYEKYKDELYQLRDFVCEYCKDSYQAVDTGVNRFCSDRCKSAYRRASGIDNEIRRCEVCGNEFTTNKYRKTRTCSRACANRLPSRC